MMGCEYSSLCPSKSLLLRFLAPPFLQENVMKKWDKSALYSHSYVGHTGTR